MTVEEAGGISSRIPFLPDQPDVPLRWQLGDILVVAHAKALLYWILSKIPSKSVKTVKLRELDCAISHLQVMQMSSVPFNRHGLACQQSQKHCLESDDG